jgi:hypothetical protein
VVACRGTSEEGAIPVSHLRYQSLEKEESRVELVRVASHKRCLR